MAKKTLSGPLFAQQKESLSVNAAGSTLRAKPLPPS